MLNEFERTNEYIDYYIELARKRKGSKEYFDRYLKDITKLRVGCALFTVLLVLAISLGLYLISGYKESSI